MKCFIAIILVRREYRPWRVSVKVDIGAVRSRLSRADGQMKVDLDLKAGFLQTLKREVLAILTPEERAVIEVSTGEMGNKPDAVKLGWLKMRTKEPWTKQQYLKALDRTMKKLREAVAEAEKKDS